MKRTGRLAAAFAPVAAVILICVACVYFRPHFVARLDDFVYDAWMRLGDKPAPHPVPAIVEIDDASLARLGQWPWPRTLLGDLVERILADGAAAVALDILLVEPDRSSPAALGAALKERLGVDIDLGAVPPEYLDNDRYFSDVIRGRPVVLGAFATLSGAEALPERLPRATGLAEKTPPGAPEPRETITRASGLVVPLRVFSDAAPVGVTNATMQADGVIRTVPLLVRAGDNVYATLSLRALMAAQGRGGLRLDSDEDGLATLQAGSVRVPVAPDGSFRPVYQGPARTYPYYSAADVLDGRVGEEKLGGRIVLVGPSAVGLLDIRATPLDPAVPGVEIHATLIDNMLSGRHMVIPPYAPGLQVLAVILSACLAFAAFGFLPAMGYAPLALAIVGASLWGSWLCFARGLFISPVYAVMATLLVGAVLLPLRFRREQRARRQIKRAFAHYVAPEVVNRIADNGTRALDGESREVSVLFTDVRGFTTISETMEPGRLVRLLNSYFTPMTACVIAREGTLDKFIGDALMAFWNAPLDVPGHQEKAVRAALDMQKTLAELRPRFLQEFGVEVRIGAGIHAGPVQVGNMGSRDLLNYTCIGDTVNLASRLEGLCKRYGAGIVVSSAVTAQCRDLHFRQLDRIRVKGSTRPLDIFTPLEPCAEPDSQAEETWRRALNAYFLGDFAGGALLFGRLLAVKPMAAAAQLFLDRCAQLQAHTPVAWEGVWTYDTK